jgi:ribosomal protein L5
MKYYLDSLIRYEILNKFGLSNLGEKLGLEKIVINISIRDQIYEYSSSYSRSLFLLEHITSRRSYIRSYASKMRGRGKKSTFCTLQISLRKDELFNFLNILYSFAQVKLIKKNITLNNLLTENLLSFELEDISIFPGIEEEFLHWRYPLNFNFVFNILKNDEMGPEQALLVGRNFNLYLLERFLIE